MVETNGQTDATDGIIFLTNAVGIVSYDNIE